MLSTQKMSTEKYGSSMSTRTTTTNIPENNNGSQNATGESSGSLLSLGEKNPESNSNEIDFSISLVLFCI